MPSVSAAAAGRRPTRREAAEAGGGDASGEGDEGSGEEGGWYEDEDEDDEGGGPAPVPQYHLVERRAIGGAFSRAPRLVKTPAEPEPPPPDPEPPRTPPRAGRGAIFGKMTAPRLSGAALAAWQLPPGGPSAVPASPAPTELSDAATDIAPLGDLDAAVRPRVPGPTFRPASSSTAARPAARVRAEVLSARRGPGKYEPSFAAVDKRVVTPSFGTGARAAPPRRPLLGPANTAPPGPGAHSLPAADCSELAES